MCFIIYIKWKCYMQTTVLTVIMHPIEIKSHISYLIYIPICGNNISQSPPKSDGLINLRLQWKLTCAVQNCL